MQGQDVVSSDDQKIGTIVAEQDGFVIVEMGHVFKAKHAIPLEFLHEFEGVQRATVDRGLVSDSPKIENGELDVAAVRLHYGLVEVPVDPDAREPTILGEDKHRNHDSPAFGQIDQMTNSYDPEWTTAGLSERDPERDDAIDRDHNLGDPS